MNNNEFDDIIKSNLENASVTPSQHVGKSLGRKMLVKNIWFFHKKKAALLLLLIGGTSMLYWKNFTNTQTSSTTQLAHKTKSELNTVNKIADDEVIVESNQNDESLVQKTNADDENFASSDITPRHSTTSYTPKKNPASTPIAKDINNNKNLIQTSPSIANSKANEKTIVKQSDEQLLADINEAKENNERFSNKQPIFITPTNTNDLVNFTYENNINDDYAKTSKSSFSFDAYLTPYNQTKIANNLDQQYHKNWWDFYRETGMVSSGIEGGIRANFDWNNIVTTAGVTYNKIRDYKPKYIYESNDNQYLLNILGLNEISGVQVNGVDSAHYVFYTAQDDELIDRVENETYSTYHYINFPIKTGYEFKTNKFSVLLQAGVAFNKLIGANGTYLRRYQTSETLDIYYNKGIETALLARRNSMLRKSYVSLLASLAGNVRVSPTLDVFGEFSFNQSHNSLTETEYFLQKDVMNFGTNFGLKYYLEPRIKKSNLEQELF